MAWLCIDAGTSDIKAVLVGERGCELATARQSVRLRERRLQRLGEFTVDGRPCVKSDLITAWHPLGKTSLLGPLSSGANSHLLVPVSTRSEIFRA
jgi:hypothetical protein